MRNNILLVAVIGAVGLALALLLMQLIGVFHPPSPQDRFVNARNDANYVNVTYVNYTATVTLREEQKTDFLDLVHADSQNQVSQFVLRSAGCFGERETESYVLTPGENVTSCYLFVRLLDVPSEDSATFNLEQRSCYCPICWHLVFGRSDVDFEMQQVMP